MWEQTSRIFNQAATRISNGLAEFLPGVVVFCLIVLAFGILAVYVAGTEAQQAYAMNQALGFVLAGRDAPESAIDACLERTGQAFEDEKPYLISRWRWPERFRPVRFE